ncbi:hypothetical protein Celaphus_00016757, partial [Cervus elaphus hippelaphus]
CIYKALKEKITILVTHQLQYLEDTSQILILKDGKMVRRGTYSEFLKSRVDTLSLAEETKQFEPSPVLGTPTDHLEGKVGFNTYENYFTAHADWSVIIFLILVNIAAQVAYALQDWWLAYWANVQSGLYFGAFAKGDEDIMFVLNWYLGVYSGRILNRFSKDIGHMDDLLPLIVLDFI